MPRLADDPGAHDQGSEAAQILSAHRSVATRIEQRHISRAAILSYSFLGLVSRQQDQLRGLPFQFLSLALVHWVFLLYLWFFSVITRQALPAQSENSFGASLTEVNPGKFPLL